MGEFQPNLKNHSIRMQIRKGKQGQQRLTNILEVCMLQSIMTDIIRDQEIIREMDHINEDIKGNT